MVLEKYKNILNNTAKELGPLQMTNNILECYRHILVYKHSANFICYDSSYKDDRYWIPIVCDMSEFLKKYATDEQ